MKKYIFYFLIIGFGFALTSSCSHNNPNHDHFTEAKPDEGNLYIDTKERDPQAYEPTRTIIPVDNSIEFVIKNNSPVYAGEYARPIEVNYELKSLKGDTDPNDFFQADSSTLTIPAGENITHLDFQVNENIRNQIQQNQDTIAFRIILSTDDKVQADEDVSSIDVIFPQPANFDEHERVESLE